MLPTNKWLKSLRRSLGRAKANPLTKTLNIPMTSCPHCKNRLKFIDILGMDNWSPTVCSNCNRLCMATDSSLIFWFVSFIALISVLLFWVSVYTEINKVMTIGIALVIWPLTFPVMVRAKKFKQRKYWLPKSRLLGYFIYLVVPITVIVLALVLASYLGLGM